MVAGLPGTGIGGCFFLLSALLMPFVELVRVFQGKSSRRRWRFIARHSGLAVGILGALWFTGWALGRILYTLVRLDAISAPGSLGPRNFIQEQPIVITLMTLLFVLLAVKFLQKTAGAVQRSD